MLFPHYPYASIYLVFIIFYYYNIFYSVNFYVLYVLGPIV